MRPPIVTIRIATQLDLPAVTTLVDTVLVNNKHTYAGNIMQASCRNLVATYQKRIVGYVTVLASGAEPNGKALWERIRPYIGFVGVLPEARSCGIGSELINQAAIFVFLSTRETFLYLECEPQLKGLYEACGFEVVPPVEVERQFGANPTKSTVLRISRKAALS